MHGRRHIGGPSTTHRRLAPLPKEPSRISLMYLIFLETRIIHLHFPANSFVSIFIQFFLVGAATSRKTFAFLKEGCFSPSRSSKVDKFGANRKCGVDFLLVCNSNFGPILHRFRDMTGFMCYLPIPIQPQFWVCSRCTRSPMLGVSQHMDLKLFGREIIF